MAHSIFMYLQSLLDSSRSLLATKLSQRTVFKTVAFRMPQLDPESLPSWEETALWELKVGLCHEILVHGMQLNTDRYWKTWQTTEKTVQTTAASIHHR